MKNFINNIIESQKFTPTLLGIFLNPFWFARINLFNNIKIYGKRLTGNILDIGCGTKPYKKYLKGNYKGLEIDNENKNEKNTDSEILFFDGKIFPLKNDSIDSVLCTQVLEHVEDPTLFFSEIKRILKKDGLILLTVPFVWAEHDVPNDFNRFTIYGIKKLLVENQLEVIEQKKTGNNLSIIGQLINSYCYDILPNKIKYNIITHIFLYGFFNLLFYLLSKIFPLNDNLYLDNIILAKFKNN
jgi:SAM-dependent methyltransferase|tara:strand:+ start:1421 stop:2146 length:726 start_codon:yes stop_codon:yes gene_type:complete